MFKTAQCHRNVGQLQLFIILKLTEDAPMLYCILLKFKALAPLIQRCTRMSSVHAQKIRCSPRISYFKTHHHIILFVRPLHSKPGMESYC